MATPAPAAAAAAAAPGLLRRLTSGVTSAGGYLQTGITSARTANLSATKSLETFLRKLDLKQVADSGIPLLVLGLATLAYVIAAVICSFDFESPSNIARKQQRALSSWSVYGTQEGGRNSMDQTITAVASTMAKDQMILTNFYIQTANVAGLLQAGSRTVGSVDAIRFALLGGARAFVFDVWPDVVPGDGQHGPVLLTMEPNSMWRRTSYNSVPLVSALSQLVYVAFQAGYKSTTNDALIVYLRFRYPPTKNGPRVDTMDMTARTLQSTIQPYRLDASFNRCRAQGTIPMLPLSVFAKKIIVVSNTSGVGSALVDYINIAPQGGIPVEVAKDYAKSIIPSAAGGSGDAKASAVATIQQNLTFVAPLGEDPDAYRNGWDVAAAQSLGVHCCAMNLDPMARSGQETLAQQFKLNSYVLKPKDLWYAPTTLPAPQRSPDPGFGSGSTAGSITMPQAMRSPM